MRLLSFTGRALRTCTAALLCLACAPLHAQGAGWTDTHVHLRAVDGNYTAALRFARAQMDRFGVGISIVMPPPFPQDAGNRNTYEYTAFLAGVRAGAGRFAFLGGGGSLNGLIGLSHREGTVTAAQLQAFESQADAILRDGALGFGEIAIEHLSHFAGHPYESVPADHPLLLRLAAIAAARDVPIDVHMDVVDVAQPLPAGLSSQPNPEHLQPNVPAFERLLAQEPRARIVLAHGGWDVTGQLSAALLGRLLAAHVNLFVSIKINPAGVPANNPLTPMGIKPEWLALLLEFSDRFVIGSDSFYAASSSRGPVAQVQLPGPARLLSRLPPAMAAQIGVENARRIYRLP